MRLDRYQSTFQLQLMYNNQKLINVIQNTAQLSCVNGCISFVTYSHKNTTGIINSRQGVWIHSLGHVEEHGHDKQTYMHTAPLFSLKTSPLGKYVQWHRPVPGMTSYASKLTHSHPLTLWRRNYFFLILAHPVYKM